MKVLHVFFSSVVNPLHKFLGTTKDIRGRTQYFRKRGIEYQELVLQVRKEKYFRRALRGIDLSGFPAVFIEGTYFPEAAERIKAEYPDTKVFMRGINAELYHWLHSAHAAFRFDTWKRVLFDVKGAVDFGLKDLFCARQADCILPIAEWEAQCYWSLLTSSDRITTLPYFLPEAYLKEIPAARAKEPRCVCMMTTKAGRPFLIDAAKNLYQLVNELGNKEPHWKFAITGDFNPERLPPCPRMEVKGFLENPLEILAESRAVALLSDYGFGFKTKLLEAICCGCYILVRKKLHSRLPWQVQRYSIVVDINSIQSFQEALVRSMAPFPDGDPNGSLREEAFAALDSLLGLKTPSREPRKAPAMA